MVAFWKRYYSYLSWDRCVFIDSMVFYGRCMNVSGDGVRMLMCVWQEKMIEDVRIGFVEGNLWSRAFYCHLTNIEFLICLKLQMVLIFGWKMREVSLWNRNDFSFLLHAFFYAPSGPLGCGWSLVGSFGSYSAFRAIGIAAVLLSRTLLCIFIGTAFITIISQFV